MSQNGPTYIKWNLTKNGSLLPKITHICGKETKFQNRIDTPGLNDSLTRQLSNVVAPYQDCYNKLTTVNKRTFK